MPCTPDRPRDLPARAARTCWSASRATSRACWPGSRHCPGRRSRSGTPAPTGPRPHRETHPQGRHRQREAGDRLPLRRPSHPGHPPLPAEQRPSSRQASNRWRTETVYAFTDPARRAGHPRPSWPPGSAALAHREQPALGPRRHFRGGPVPGPNRQRSTGPGHLAQPGDQPSTPDDHPDIAAPYATTAGNADTSSDPAADLPIRGHLAMTLGCRQRPARLGGPQVDADGGIEGRLRPAHPGP